MDCKGQNQYQGVFLPVSPELSSPSPDAFLLLLISPGLCFQIPDKQYVLTALAARAKLRAWHDVDALFTTKVGALGLSALQWRCRLAIPRLLGSQVSRLLGHSRSSYWLTFFLQHFIFQSFRSKENQKKE